MKAPQGVAAFEQRYGFLAKPAQVRFRLLDPCLYIHGLSDLQIPADEFATLDPPGVEQVFITENDINGLAFPGAEKINGHFRPRLWIGAPDQVRLAVR